MKLWVKVNYNIITRIQISDTNRKVKKKNDMIGVKKKKQSKESSGKEKAREWINQKKKYKYILILKYNKGAKCLFNEFNAEAKHN